MSSIAETTLLTVAEASEMLRLSTTEVRSLCSVGELPHHRMGTGKRAIRIPREEVQAYLDRTRVEGASPTIPIPPPRRPARSASVGYAMLRKYGYKG